MSRAAAIREAMAQHPKATWTASALAVATGFERKEVARSLIAMEHQRLVERVGIGTYLLCRLPQRQPSGAPAQRGPCAASDGLLRTMRAAGRTNPLTTKQLSSRVGMGESLVLKLLGKLAAHELVVEQNGSWRAA